MKVYYDKDANLDVIKNSFSFLKTHPTLNKNKDFLITLINEIDDKINIVFSSTRISSSMLAWPKYFSHTIFPFFTIGLSTILCIPKIPVWGGLSIGVESIEP